jgi:hypothetical protein
LTLQKKNLTSRLARNGTGSRVQAIVAALSSVRFSPHTLMSYYNQIDQIRLHYNQFSAIINGGGHQSDAFARIQSILENWGQSFASEIELRRDLNERMLLQSGPVNQAIRMEAFLGKATNSYNDLDDKNKLIEKC